MFVNKVAIALTAALALAACRGEEEDDKTATVTTAPESAAPVEDGTLKITGWDEQYVIDLKDLAVVVPENRLFHMDATAFCPSLSGKVTNMDEYTSECRDITEAKAQYNIDVYACRGHGDTFYAYMPTNNLAIEKIFSTDATIEEIDPARLFTVGGMRRQFERFGNDNFTVTKATYVGAPEKPYSYSDAMTSYIERGIGRHSEQNPVCSAQFEHNLR